MQLEHTLIYQLRRGVGMAVVLKLRLLASRCCHRPWRVEVHMARAVRSLSECFPGRLLARKRRAAASAGDPRSRGRPVRDPTRGGHMLL